MKFNTNSMPLVPPLDDPAQASGLAVQVEPHGQRMEVLEGLEARLADRPLADLGEHRIAQLAESLLEDTGRAVGDQDADGHDDHACALPGEDIDGQL